MWYIYVFLCYAKRHIFSYNLYKNNSLLYILRMYTYIELWGLKIGYKVSNYKYRGSFSNLSYQIEDMVKLATQQNYDCRHWEFIYSALQTYKHIYGHIDIPLDYEVPEGPAWGSELWGLKLGCRVRNIRYSKLYTFTCIHTYSLAYACILMTVY